MDEYSFDRRGLTASSEAFEYSGTKHSLTAVDQSRLLLEEIGAEGVRI